jgi:CheY-like chemotaxis protein
MTVQAMEGGSRKCPAAGMDDYLGKPVRVSEPKAVLERAKQVRSNENS